MLHLVGKDRWGKESKQRETVENSGYVHLIGLIAFEQALQI